jgi:hypothetical protein
MRTRVLRFLGWLSSAGERQFFPSKLSRRGLYSDYLQAMHEPSLYEQRFQPGMQFRFFHIPSFRGPSAIRITRTATGPELRVIRLSGACDDPQKIKLEQTRNVDETQWKHFLTLLEKASFWASADEESDRCGLDGSQWVLEGRADAHYHVVDRWSPRCEMSEPNLEAFVACCGYLWELAEFSEELH